jgi:hypothetical protein
MNAEFNLGVIGPAREGRDDLMRGIGAWEIKQAGLLENLGFF